MDPTAARILEIGDHHHFKSQYPDRTSLLWTGRRPPRGIERDAYVDCTPSQLVSALRDAARGRYDIIVTYATLQSPWHPRYWLRSVARTPFNPVAAVTRVFGVSLLRFVRLSTPLVVLDMHDAFTIEKSSFFLLDKAKFYFKRELPIDHWHALYGCAHANLPTSRVRRSGRWQARIAKLRPISLQARVLDLGDPESIFAAKSADIFFSGATELNSTVRQTGLRQLEVLASRGARVDVLRGRLPQDEFYRRMAKAWLAWSPSGLGWDCYRHYEAPQCLSVPVINYPTIIRHFPLEDGVHAFYYPPEGDGLVRVVESALADKEKLRRMALMGSHHVRAHHAGSAFCDRVLNVALRGEDEG